MVVTETVSEIQTSASAHKNNETSITGAYLGSVEEEIVMVDATVRPEVTVMDAHSLLTVDELLPPKFIETHTEAEDAEEFFAPHEVTERSDLLDLPSTVDDFIAYGTPFGDLAAMLQAAVEFRI